MSVDDMHEGRPISGDTTAYHEPSACALCGYSLCGLPEQGTCPECGFRYDPHCRVLRLALYGRAVLYLVLAALLSLVYARLWLQTGFTSHDIILVLGLAIVTLWAWRRIGPPWRRRCVMVLSGVGVEFRHPFKGRISIPWGSIQRVGVAASRRGMKLVIEGPDGALLLDWPAKVLGGRENAARCAAEINRAMEVYGAASTDATTPCAS